MFHAGSSATDGTHCQLSGTNNTYATAAKRQTLARRVAATARTHHDSAWRVVGASRRCRNARAETGTAHRGEIHPKLIQRLKAWGKYFGSAKLGALTLIEFRDEQARNELLDDPELKPHLEHFDAGNRPLVLVRAEALAHVKELLAERGVDIHAWENP